MTMRAELIRLLEDAKGRCWINGRPPERNVLCIRITEADRLHILAALQPWWRWCRRADGETRD